MINLKEAEELIEQIMGKAWLCTRIEGGDPYIAQPLDTEADFETYINTLHDANFELHNRLAKGEDEETAILGAAEEIFNSDPLRLELFRSAISEELDEDLPINFTAALETMTSVALSQIEIKPYTVIISLDINEVEDSIDIELVKGIHYPLEIPSPSDGDPRQPMDLLCSALKILRAQILLSAKCLS